MAETTKTETTETHDGNTETKTTKTETGSSQGTTGGAAAMPEGEKPGPASSPVQVRDAGEEAHADRPEDWDKHDEAVDESFPASDATAKY